MATVVQINPSSFESQDYSSQDENLLLAFDINTFLTEKSSIEFHVYTPDKNLVKSNLSFEEYEVPGDASSTSPDNLSSISINPLQNLIDSDFSQGEYVTYYSFINNEIGNAFQVLYVDEISSDRTELRLKNNGLTSEDFIEQAEEFIDKREESEYFVDFYLNFFDNELALANNIKLVNEETDDPSLLVKLYEPLSDDFDVKDILFIATQFEEPLAYQVSFPIETFERIDFTYAQGPNFAIPVKDQVNNSSQNLSYTDIISSASTGSQNQIDSLLSQSAINISVDYNNFSDFIHFSSAQTRIENFYYKVGLIETYTSESNTLTNVTGSSTSKLIIEKKVSNVIKNFDKFEYFMYYSSGSAISYPKSTSTAPYTLFPTTSSQALTWLGSTNENSGNFGGLLLSASNYDNANPDQLVKSIPEYLREDPDNQQYDLFVDMVAQYYDSVWLYTKDITQKYNADNRLNFGVSKDLVADAIRDFGFILYKNNF